MTEISPPRGHTYRAYLVRLWQVGPDGPWRALTRDAETHDERRFATVEQLFLFLHRQTEGAGSDEAEEPRHDQPKQKMRGE